jgi:F-type H+-transporting ATPase subunit epsilon
MTTQNLRLVLVTPETTLLDTAVSSLRFPMFDGQIGILPGRAPLVGRLGCGELQITEGGSTKSYYVDGGFVQVKEGVVSLLTHRADPVKILDPAKVETELQTASQQKAHSDEEFAKKFADLERARRRLALARRAR